MQGTAGSGTPSGSATTRTARRRRAPGVTAAVSWAACAWAATFGLVHVYWAAGGALGLPAGMRLPEHPRLFAAALAAVPCCGVALVLSRRVLTDGHPRRRARLVALTALAAAFFTAHSLPSMIGVAARVVSSAPAPLSETERLALYLYEPWWFLGAVLYAALAALAGGRPPSP